MNYIQKVSNFIFTMQTNCVMIRIYLLYVLSEAFLDGFLRVYITRIGGFTHGKTDRKKCMPDRRR